jgi:hypothetical protein
MRVQAFLLALCLIFASVLLPVQAQDSNCDIELEETILALIQAQRQADSGNTFGAVQRIDDIQIELAALAEACSGVLFPLPRSFTAPDGSIAFNYPDEWVLSHPNTNVTIIATPNDVLSKYENGDEMIEGEQMMVVLRIDATTLTDDGDFDNVANDLWNDLGNSFASVSPLMPIEVNGKPTWRFSIEDGRVAGMVDIINYVEDEAPAVLVIMSLGANSERDMVETILESFEKSVQHPAIVSLRQLGVSLDSLTYDNAIFIEDFSEDIDMRTAALAPDGSAIAWFARGGDGAICLYTFATEAITCKMAPNSLRGNPLVLHWSPDSATIGFTNSYFHTFLEPDIFVYDVANNQIINLTDDGIDDDWNPFTDTEETVWIDALLTWGADGYIYFIREEAVPPGSDNLRNGFYRVAPGQDEAEPVRDLTLYFERYPTSYRNEHFLDGVMSVSPDAQQIAFVVMEPQIDAPNNGVWVMDLTGEAPPQQLASMTDFNLGLPAEYADDLLFPIGLAWDAEGDGLYVMANTPVRQLNYWLAYHIDVATGAMTLLTDLTEFTAEELITVDEATGLAPEFFMAKAGVLAPDASGLLIFNGDQEQAGLSALRMEDGVGEQELLYQIEEYRRVPAYAATIAANGIALINGYLFFPSE